MPRTRRSTKRGAPRGNVRRRRGCRSAFVPVESPAPVEQGPPRGVKLKTVSRFTMLFALICLGAFWAGRPPVAADAHFEATAGRPKRVGAARPELRDNDARRVLFSLRR